MYPKNAVSAITGLLNVLSQTFDRGFLFGLHEAFFDIALFWGLLPTCRDGNQGGQGKS